MDQDNHFRNDLLAEQASLFPPPDIGEMYHDPESGFNGPRPWAWKGKTKYKPGEYIPDATELPDERETSITSRTTVSEVDPVTGEPYSSTTTTHYGHHHSSPKPVHRDRGQRG